MLERMDLADRVDALSRDVSRMALEHGAYSNTARSLTNELALIKSRVDLHALELEKLGNTVATVHAITREIREAQGVFADDTVKHVQRMHRTLSVQSEILGSVAEGVARAVEISTSQNETLAALSRVRKTFAIAPTLIGFGLFIAGLVAGLLR